MPSITDVLRRTSWCWLPLALAAAPARAVEWADLPEPQRELLAPYAEQ